jgi:sugar lactone lactonase YvrE
VAGKQVSAFSGDGGPATNAAMLSPSGVAIDTVGNLFIADQWNNRIRKVSTNGIINTVAGIGPSSTSGSYSGDGGIATNAGLNLVAYYYFNGFMHVLPAGVAVDSFGNFYVADAGDNRIRKVDTNGIINTIAGTNSAGFSGDSKLAVNAKLNSSSGVAVDSSGNVFIADAGNNVIRKVDVNGVITTLAGNGSAGYAGGGGAATNASLNQPHGVAVDSSGNVFIADTGNNVIRKMDVNGIITTLAGNGSAGYAGDGGGGSPQMPA